MWQKILLFAAFSFFPIQFGSIIARFRKRTSTSCRMEILTSCLVTVSLSIASFGMIIGGKLCVIDYWVAFVVRVHGSFMHNLSIESCRLSLVMNGFSPFTSVSRLMLGPCLQYPTSSRSSCYNMFNRNWTWLSITRRHTNRLILSASSNFGCFLFFFKGSFILIGASITERIQFGASSVS